MNQNQNNHQKSRTNRIRGKQRYYQHRYQQRELAVDSTGPVLNVLVCLMQWTNHPDRNTAIPVDDHRNLFNGDGRDPTLFPGGTVSDYFKTMSYGDFQIKFEVTDWIMTDYAERFITDVRKKVGDGHVIGAVSGGVDSTVAAVLMNRAIGHRFHAVMVDNGCLRKDEASSVLKRLNNECGVDLRCIDAADRFLNLLKGVTDPEKRAKDYWWNLH